ncbi:MAG: polysaccharide deacetylase family protein [Burkholderiales bacterium]
MNSSLPAATVAASPDEGRRVPVLMYHRIGSAQGDWERRFCISPSQFCAHMDALSHHGWQPCSLRTFVTWIRGECTVPERTVLITFDDGYLGLYEHALPILGARGWPFVLFVVPALVGKHDLWSANENPSGRTYPLLGWNHLREMQTHHASMGSHSLNHANLTALGDTELSNELTVSRAQLEDRLGAPITELAYPYGLHDERVVQAARLAGYATAFSVRSGFNGKDSDRMRIRRLDVFGTDSASALIRKLKLGSNDGGLTNFLRYYASRAAARIGIGSI